MILIKNFLGKYYKEILITIVSVILGFLLGKYVYQPDIDQIKETVKYVKDIKEIVKTDTITDVETKYKYKTKLQTDTLIVQDIKHDTVQILLDKEQKQYKTDQYEAWISGYKPELDSIKTYNKTITDSIFVTQTIEKQTVKYKKNWFSIGPNVGVGYDFVNKRPIPYVGVGVNLNLINLKK